MPELMPQDQETEPRPVFAVVLRPLSGVDAIRALRALLKAALRRHGLECLDVRWLNGERTPRP